MVYYVHTLNVCSVLKSGQAYPADWFLVSLLLLCSAAIIILINLMLRKANLYRSSQGLGAIVVFKGNSRLGSSVERLGQLLSFLVPRKTRIECFEPFFEDLKADRLEKLARSGSRGVKRWIELCFYFRLCVTVVQSLGCYLGETLSKIAPFIRALFFKSGS